MTDPKWLRFQVQQRANKVDVRIWRRKKYEARR
jgi:hypothetical protein